MLCLLHCPASTCVLELDWGEVPKPKVVPIRGIQPGGGTWGGIGVGEMKELQGWEESMGDGKGERRVIETRGRPAFAVASAQCAQRGMLAPHSSTTFPSCFPKWSMAKFLQCTDRVVTEAPFPLDLCFSPVWKFTGLSKYYRFLLRFVFRNYFCHKDNLGCTRKAGNSVAFILQAVVMMGGDSSFHPLCRWVSYLSVTWPSD